MAADRRLCAGHTRREHERADALDLLGAWALPAPTEVSAGRRNTCVSASLEMGVPGPRALVRTPQVSYRRQATGVVAAAAAQSMAKTLGSATSRLAGNSIPSVNAAATAAGTGWLI